MNAPCRIVRDRITERYAPGRLWSLLDMLKVDAAAFAKTTAALQRIQDAIQSWYEDNPSAVDETLGDNIKKRATDELDRLLKAIGPLDLKLSEKGLSRCPR